MVIVPPSTSARFRAEDLGAFVVALLAAHGATPDDAAATADALVHADLRGVTSHGLGMLSENRAYAIGLRAQTVNARPNRRVLHESPSTALFDNDLGLGAAGATAAMRLAIEKAASVGSGIVAVTNGNHYGMAAHYAMMALPHGMIGLSLCNSRPYVAASGGLGKMLGTNPIALAAPAGEEPPFVLDMATSAVAVGKLIVARRTGRQIPLGWAQDRDGRDTDDPAAPAEGGWLMPLGGRPETSGYKGYGLAAMVDVLSGVLSGIGISSMLAEIEGVGQFLAAIRVDGFQPLDRFTALMDAAIREWRATPPVDPAAPVQVPGDPERRTHAERATTGIPIHPSIHADLATLGEEAGVRFPDPV